MQKSKSVLQLRVQKKIHYLLQDMFIKSDISYKDKEFLVSISDVDISPDLRNLKVYVEIPNLDLSLKKEVVKKLNKENVYVVKGLIAKQINLKFVPEILFILDNKLEKIEKINELIEKEKCKTKS